MSLLIIPSCACMSVHGNLYHIPNISLFCPKWENCPFCKLKSQHTIKEITVEILLMLTLATYVKHNQHYTPYASTFY